MAPQSAMAASQIINEEADHNFFVDHNRDWETLKKAVVGIKFKPSPVVLTGYLAGKMSGSTDGLIGPLIREVDVYQHEPSKLKSKAYDFGDGNIYVFSRIRKKCEKGLIYHRIAEGGFWKTGKVNDIKDKDDRKIGSERSLTYYRNDPESGKGIKTNWLMREYILLEGQDDKEPMTLCWVYFHDKKRRPSESENEVPYDNENKQNSLPDVEGPEGFASSKSKNLLDMATSEIHPGVSRKRQRPSSECSNNNPPLIHSSSNPEAVTLEQTLPSSYSYPNMPNTGSCVDQSNVFTPCPNCNPLLYSTPNPAAVTFEQTLFVPPNSCQNIIDITNGSWCSIVSAQNNNFPLYSSNSNPAAFTTELPSSNSYHNMHNMMGGSSGATADSNTDTLNYCPSTHAEPDLEKWVNDNTQLLREDLFENPS